MVQSLISYIEDDFCGDLSAYAKFINVESKVLAGWLDADWAVENGQIYHPDYDKSQGLIVENHFNSDLRFPLYIREDITQGWLVLNVLSGHIYGENGYSELHGCGYGTRKYFYLNPKLTKDEIDKVINSHLHFFQAILDGRSVEYINGGLMCSFSEESCTWLDKLTESLRDYDGTQTECILDDTDDFLDEDPFGKKVNAVCLEDMVEYIEAKVEEGGFAMSDSLKLNLQLSILNYYRLLYKNNDETAASMPKWVLELIEWYQSQTAHYSQRLSDKC